MVQMWHLVRVNRDRELTELAVQQGGVIRRDQALEHGFSKGVIGRRTRAGQWRSVGRFGYRVIDMHGMTNLVRAAVTVLPDAVVSHESAAEIHDFPKMPRGIASVSVHSRTTHDFPDVVVHRCHDLLKEHIVEVLGLPVTSIPRTIVDLATQLKSKHLEAIFGSLITEKRVATDEIKLVVDQIARRGKPGIQKIRSILEERETGPRDGTPLERRGAQILRTFGIPEPAFEFPLPWNPRKRFDAAFPHAKLAIEWDSRLWHDREDGFERDRERDRQALLHGWRVVRFTWSDVIHRPEEVADTVRRLLSSATQG
jgi:hypothetical protein